jgi:uncharacterized protein YecE (DUF72 family)
VHRLHSQKEGRMKKNLVNKYRKKIHIGTSGWHYDHWQGPFYPESIPKEEFLAYYCERFHTVEINNTFYQMPEKKTLSNWKETVPQDFIFSVKASRYITHMKKLKDPSQPVNKFLNRVDTIKDRLGPILFQLPPRWHCNPERLINFLDKLPSGYRYTFEFRDPTWFKEEIYDILRDNNAAFCMYDFNGRLSPKIITSDFIYIRLHGPDGKYSGQYSEQALAEWVGAFSQWLKKGEEIFCYFDNDEKGYAVQNAIELRKMLE